VVVCTHVQQSLASKLVRDQKPHRTFGRQGIYQGIFYSSSSYHPSPPHQAFGMFQVQVLQCDYLKARGARDQGAPCQRTNQRRLRASSTPPLSHSGHTLTQPRSYIEG